MKNDNPIGVFDSGVGGLTVVKEIIKKLPNENIIYFGDTKRVPYGEKSKEDILKFSCQIIRFLKEQNVKAIVIACNTVSSNCYEDLKKQFSDIPIIEIINSGVNSAIKSTKNNKIGVIGTDATIKTNKYNTKIKEKLKNSIVFSRACPLFVPLVEEGLFNTEKANNTIKMYLQEFKEKDIDTLILGCTHYPFLENGIKKFLGNNINIINPALETAIYINKFFKENNLLNKNTNSYKKFFISDINKNFDFICSLLLNKNYCAKKIDIENY